MYIDSPFLFVKLLSAYRDNRVGANAIELADLWLAIEGDFAEGRDADNLREIEEQAREYEARKDFPWRSHETMASQAIREGSAILLCELLVAYAWPDASARRRDTMRAPPLALPSGDDIHSAVVAALVDAPVSAACGAV